MPVLFSLLLAYLAAAEQVPYPPVSPVDGELALGLSNRARSPLQPVYNSTTHLQLEMPSNVHSLSHAAAGTNFSHSTPFRVFSDEGLRAWHSLLLQFLGERTQSQRGSECLRGLVYKSSFIREAMNDPLLNKFLSDLVGQKLHLFDHTMNQAHVNFGYAGQDGADAWHIDSHPLVLIVMLSDHEDGDGGELLIAPPGHNHADKFEVLHEIASGADVPMQKFRIPMGYGIFVRGSEMPHAVAPLLQGPTRISLTNGYQFADHTVSNENSLRTWRMFDNEIADFEFFRSEAWRSSLKLRTFVNSPIGEGWNNGVVLAEKLRSVAQDLERAAKILGNEMVEPLKSVLPKKETSATSVA